MTSGKETLLHVVCPVYHEQDNIGPLWAEVTKFFDFPFVLSFVYDDPKDPTLPVLEELCAAHPDKVRIILNPQKGVVGALKEGFRLMPSDAPVLVMMADLSDDLKIVGRMVKAWEDGAKVVVASRYMRGGRQIGGGLVKRGLSTLAGKSLYWLKRLPVQDATNNFRLYDSDLLKSLELESVGGFEIAFEITVKAFKKKLKIVEIPSVWRDRTAGKSNFKLMKWLPHYLKWYRYAFSN